jgi:hypothetical protein
MRASIWLAALAVGLALAGRGTAQQQGMFPGNSPATASRTSLTKATGGSFGLTNFLHRIRTSLSTRGTSGYSSIPDPTTNPSGYLKAFGFKTP